MGRYIVDNFKRLELEYEGIRKTILEYTTKGNIINFLDGLKLQIRAKDMESIKYYLNEICEWYSENISIIKSNEFVFDYSSHDRNKHLLEDLSRQFELENNHVKVGKQKETDMYNKIFLSHCSSDVKYGNALRDLLMGLGINKQQLIYTSHPLHKIPTGNNIFDYLKDNINKNIFIIFLWSNEYLKSAACLNEMGAAWICESNYVNVYTPDFDFNNPQYNNCAVDTRKMGIVLNSNEQCKIGIIELKNEIVRGLGLSIDEQEWIFNLDKFMKDIL